MNNLQQVHDVAIVMAANLGMDSQSAREVVGMVANDNPMLLIGGYNIDVVIVAMAAVLSLEDGFQKDAENTSYGWADTDRDLVISTINACLDKIVADGSMV